ncbi:MULTISPECIES: GAF domain-containing protein [Spirulina sp. CCY15215]|uniref:GAF domain-containing protein n=1 Tax=Spirulina sp. CCY15215 TaxID=2767591 RepID=UPI00194E171C|nr:GAF domain-containing protein [Spirulina major]
MTAISSHLSASDPNTANGAGSQPDSETQTKLALPNLEVEYEQLRQQLTRVQEQMRQSRDRNALLSLTCDRLRELLQASRVLVYRFSSDRQGEAIAEAVERGWTPTLGETLPATFFGGDRQEDYDLADCTAIDYIASTKVTPYQLQLLEKYQVRAGLSCPIRMGNKVWGLLSIQQCNEARRWNQKEIGLLEQMSVALALNLVSYQFQEEVEQQQIRENAATKVITRIRRSLDIKTIFQTTTQEVRQLLKADRVGIYRFNTDWSGKFVAESVGAGWSSLMQNPVDAELLRGNSEDCNLKLMLEGRDRNGRSEIVDTYLEKTQGGAYTKGQKYRVANDIYDKNFPACYVELLERIQARAYLTVGIYQGTKLWGLLATYQCSAPRTWEQGEIRLLVQIAEQLGVALQQASTLRQQRLQGEKLKKAIEREKAVAQTIDRIKQSTETQTIFRVATESIRKLLKSDRVVVYRFTPDWGGEFVAESVGEGWISLTKAQTEDPEIIAGTTDNIDTDGCTIKQMQVRELAARDTYLKRTKGGSYQDGDKYRACNDIYKANFPGCYIKLLESFQARAYVTVPIFLGNKLWGLLANYQCSGARIWGEEEIDLVVNLGSQLGLALQRADDMAQLQGQAKQLEEAVKRERTLALIGDRIKQTQKTQSIFKVATQEVRQLLGADRVGIYRFNNDWSGEFVAESVDGQWKSLLREQIENESLLEATNVNINTEGCTVKKMTSLDLISKDTYLERTRGGTYQKGDKYRACNDIHNANFPPCYIELLELFQARAYITVPIFLGKKLWGLMPTYQCSGPREWTPEEINLVVNLGSQLGIALQRAQDFERVQIQAKQLEEAVKRERTLALIGDRIKQSQETKEVFKIATQEVRQLLEADRVGIYRFNEDWSGEFVAESVDGKWKSLLREQIEDEGILAGTKLNIDTEGCTVKEMTALDLVSKDTYLERTQGGTYKTGDKYRVCNNVDKADFPLCYLDLLERFQSKAYITVPIFLGKKLWGLMPTYQCSGPREWTPEEINLVVNLGSQLSIALQRAQDLERVKAQAKKLEEAIKRERTLALIGDRIKLSQDTNEIFKIATQEVRQLLEADRVGIYRFNKDWSGEFVAESVAGNWKSLLREQIENESLLESTKLNIDSEGCTIKKMTSLDLVSKDTYLERTQGGTYRTGDRYRVCNDVDNAGFSRCYLELLERFQARSYLTVPIFLGKKLWGLMATYQCSQPREWSEEEINLVTNLGSQMGIALQRGQDLERVKAQTRKLEKAIERERAIFTISDRIKESQNIETIFNIATREARKVFNSDRVGIYRFNEDWSGEFVAESVGNDWLPLLRVQAEDVSLLEKTKANIDTDGCTIQQMRVRELVSRDTYLKDTEGGNYRKGEQFRASNDVYNSGFSTCYLELLDSFQARAYITVPIFLGQKLWGLMANYQCSGTREWESEEIQLMVQLGSQLGLALQRAQDLEQLRQQARKLEESAQREKEAREMLQRRAIELLVAVRPALEGDLTVRAPLSEDEMGTIADVYNNTLQSLRKIVMQVQTVTAQVAETSIGSDMQIRKLAAQAQQQTQELNVALDEVQKMVHSSQDVGANARAIEQAVQNANETVKSGNTAMNRTVEGILAIRNTVAETSQKIRELSESSQKIDRVVNLIGDFATQTQLLSLNAAIEATRAGEYGKGFAVVADEVRSLARQSANATSEISNLVAEIRQQTVEAIAVTESAISRVSAGTTLVEETKGNLNAIAAATAQIGKLVEDITAATQTQLDRSQSVTQTMRAVAAISNSTSEESVELSETFQNSLATAQQLQAVVKQFKVD